MSEHKESKEEKKDFNRESPSLSSTGIQLKKQECRLSFDKFKRIYKALESGPISTSLVASEPENYEGSDYCAILTEHLHQWPLLQNYIPLDLLGIGQSGVVLRAAVRSSPRQEVALKLARNSSNYGENAYAMRRECLLQTEFAKIGVAPNVLDKCYKVSVNPSRLPLGFMVSQLADGSLKDWIYEPRTSEQVSELALQLFLLIRTISIAGFTQGDAHWGNIAYIHTNKHSRLCFLDFEKSVLRISYEFLDILVLTLSLNSLLSDANNDDSVPKLVRITRYKQIEQLQRLLWNLMTNRYSNDLLPFLSEIQKKLNVDIKTKSGWTTCLLFLQAHVYDELYSGRPDPLSPQGRFDIEPNDFKPRADADSHWRWGIEDFIRHVYDLKESK